MEKRYCKKCGRPLDKGDIDYCRGCFEEEHGESYSVHYQRQQNEKDNSYTNIVAKDFKDWSKNVNVFGILISVLMLVCAFALHLIELLCVSAFVVYCLFKATSLLLLAVAEIIQKLQNIEDNTKN